MKRIFFFAPFLLASVFLFVPNADAGTTLNTIKQNGFVRCGARTTADAFAYRDADGKWQGIDVEICSLIADAITGRPEAVKIIPVNNEEGLALLAKGQIDVLAAATPKTMRNELNTQAAFPAPFYYTALAFIGHFKPEATSMRDYAGSKVCVEGTPFLLHELDTYNKRHKLDLRIMRSPTIHRAQELLYLKRCDLMLARLETLHSGFFTKRPADIDIVVLPEIVRTYATGPVVRDDDRELVKLVRWLVYALIKAEEKGVSSQTIEDFVNTEDPEIQNLLADDSKTAQALGVDPKWIYRTIAEKGNYGEIIERTLGEKSPLRLKRGANNLLKNGGLISAPSFE